MGKKILKRFQCKIKEFVYAGVYTNSLAKYRNFDSLLHGNEIPVQFITALETFNKKTLLCVILNNPLLQQFICE